VKRCVPSALVVFAALVLAAGASAGVRQVTVAVDRESISASLGHKFRFGTTITNHGSTPARNLIAHLNVLSLRDGTYVDPEDWSSHRTRYLAPIPAGGSVTLTWNMQAVNHGSFGIYVAVLPASGAPQPPAVGPTVHVSIAHRQTLNSGGVLPLALGIPAALGLLTVAVRFTHRGSRRSRA
jgi:hypothetical protein